MNRNQILQTHSSIDLAACAISVILSQEIQLFPTDEFCSTDGRPFDAPHLYIDATFATNIIVEFETRVNKTVVDYEHQTLLSLHKTASTPHQQG